MRFDPMREGRKIADELMGRKLKKGRKRTSKGEEDKLWDRQGGKCARCGRRLGKIYHIDHKRPVSLGGSESIRNKQILCPNCHAEKTREDRSKIAKAKARDRRREPRFF